MAPIIATAQNLIDNQTIAPPQDPNVTTNPLPTLDQVPSPHLNLIHILPHSFYLSIYITPSHLPKLEVVIVESTNLGMMDTTTPVRIHQECHMAEPTAAEILRMIEDLQGTVADLTFGVPTPSKNSPILGQTKSGMGQSRANMVEASSKNESRASIDPYAHLQWALRL